MFAACPISGESRNERVVRIVAVQVALASTLAIALGGITAPIILGALALDFGVRGFGSPRRSPLATFGRGIANALDLAPVPVDAAPKRFAARIGVVFSAVSAALYLAGLPLAGAAVAAVLIVCASLEAVLAFCLGCRVYSLLPDAIRRVVLVEARRS